ncbi:MAG: wax ester/triacylglycerol synthase family O-acyltransferase [Acidimicrobiales bacterium]|nr:MAG: wax ester/triacylglycerol synthase family O-acyltransferase [Acidimicrobiales bacterium]
MQRLSGLDTDFVYFETPTTHMHVGATCILDPAGAPAGPWFDAVRTALVSRLDRVPMLRRRLVEVPLRLDRPRWVDDPTFDLDHHLQRAALPSPGGAAELVELAGQIMGRRLDRGRPLWEMHVVEGLEGGMAAVVIKVHHAAADGVTAVELLARLLGPDQHPTPEPLPDGPWRPEPVPSDSELIGDALSSLAGQSLAMARAIGRTVEVAVEVGRRNRARGVSPPPAPFRAPRTSLNATIGPHRRVGFSEVSLEDVKSVKASLRVTVNEVVLAVCSGAVRRYLAAQGEEPDEPLVVLVPISAHRHAGRPANGRSGANQVSGMLVSLATDVDEPIERVRVISRGTRLARRQERVLGADALDDLAELSAPLLAAGAIQLISRLGVFDRARPLCNLVVSNVGGPASPLNLAGAPMVAIYPMAPVADGIGLNITVVTYLERLFFGLVACRDTGPDVDAIARYLSDALDELVKAAEPN